MPFSSYLGFFSLMTDCPYFTSWILSLAPSLVALYCCPNFVLFCELWVSFCLRKKTDQLFILQSEIALRMLISSLLWRSFSSLQCLLQDGSISNTVKNYWDSVHVLLALILHSLIFFYTSFSSGCYWNVHICAVSMWQLHSVLSIIPSFISLLIFIPKDNYQATSFCDISHLEKINQRFSFQ